MLRPRSSSNSRPVVRPLVWLAVAAVATSTSPVVAQTAPAQPSTTASSATASSATASPPVTKDDGGGLRTAGYILGGVGIAGFILFAVAGIGAKNAHDRLDEACAAGRCNDASHESDIADGKLLQTAANIGLATGLAGLGLGATFIVLGSHSTSDAPTTASSPSGGMITFSGRF
jgi:hypothetical protein